MHKRNHSLSSAIRQHRKWFLLFATMSVLFSAVADPNSSDPEVLRSILVENQLTKAEMMALLKLGNATHTLSPDRLRQVTSAKLNCRLVDDISALTTLPNLERLMLLHPKKIHLEATRTLKNLKVLEIADYNHWSIEPLKELTDLQILKLDCPIVRDFSPIRGLTALRLLDLSNCRVNDISALSNMTQLVVVDLSSTEVQDLTPLASLKELKGVNLSAAKIGNPNSLKSLKQISSLNLTGSSISKKEYIAIRKALPVAVVHWKTKRKKHKKKLKDGKPIFMLMQFDADGDGLLNEKERRTAAGVYINRMESSGRLGPWQKYDADANGILDDAEKRALTEALMNEFKK